MGDYATILALPAQVHTSLFEHLRSGGSTTEQAAFVFARRRPEPSDATFDFVHWCVVPRDGFVAQSGYHFELTDVMRGSVIKTAHDLDSSIVEFHSHGGPWPARFSPTDLDGLSEFVPHTWWRLRGKPYIAVVAAANDFDALIWLDNPHHPASLSAIEVNGERLPPTGLTLGYGQ